MDRARSIKWVQRITAQRQPSDKYFQSSPLPLAGEDRGVAQIDVSIDGGDSWVRADS